MSPGQKIDEVIERWNLDQVSALVGMDLVETLARLDISGELDAALRNLAVQLLHQRPEMYFSKQSVRKAFYDSMSKTKLEELAQRLSLDNGSRLASVDPSSSKDKWSKYLGFFGVDLRATPTTVIPSSETVIPEFGLFDHQRHAVERIWRALADGYGRSILHMPTGAGKTRTAMHAVCRFLNSRENTVVVWLAASGELLDQAAEAFQIAWNHLGNRNVDLVRFWGKYDADLTQMTDGIVIGGFQKFHALHARSNLAILKLGANTSLTVVDEAHQAIAPTYRAVITQLVDAGQSHALLGLTATPGRSWSDVEKDEELSNFFGRNKVTLEVEGWDDPVAYLMAEQYLARPKFRKIEYDASDILRNHSSVFDIDIDEYSADTLEILELDSNRNVAIINEIKGVIERGHKRSILFSTSVRHAEIIAASLSILGIDARAVTGETPERTRRRIIDAFRSRNSAPMVLCNFGVLTTGFDAPQTSAAVIARPTKSLVLFSQMVGRATRGIKAGGNETCEVSTVVDVTLPGFGDVSEAFTNWEDVWDEPS